MQRLSLSINSPDDIQGPPSWTNELLKREISDNFKESSYVAIKVPHSRPIVSVKKNPFKRPKDTYKIVTIYPDNFIIKLNDDDE